VGIDINKYQLLEISIGIHDLTQSSKVVKAMKDSDI
jgi:hypothetical protein